MTFLLVAFCLGAAAALLLPKMLRYMVHAHMYDSYVFASRAERTDPPGTPSHDPRPGFFLHARTILYVRFRHWLPTASKPKAVVVLAHGVGEHCGRFEHVAHAFMAKDFAVFALDHIGHGCALSFLNKKAADASTGNPRATGFTSSRLTTTSTARYGCF